MLIVSEIFFALLVNLNLLFQSFLCIYPYFSVLFFKSLSFLIYLRKFLFDFCHKLLVPDYHHISEKDELIVIVENVVNIFNGFLFQNFSLYFGSEFVQISFEDFVGSLSYFYLLLSVFEGNEFSEKLFQCVFCIFSVVLHVNHIFFSTFQ